MKTVVFNPADKTTWELLKETDALSNRAVHPPHSYSRNHLNIQLSRGGFSFGPFAPMGAYSSKGGDYGDG